MAQRSRFFDSVSGDRTYTSDAWAQVFGALAREGYDPDLGDKLLVTESNPAAMSVRVGLGVAWVQGRYFEVYSAADTLAIAAADPTNPRIDRVVVRLDMSTRDVVLAVKTGVPGVNPAAPTLQRDATIYELALADVAVAPSATSVVNANLTDQRNNGALCGVSTLTDLKIGNRTLSDATAPTGDTGTLATLLGFLANMVKQITGKASWRTAPATTLEASAAHQASTANPHATTAAQVGALPTSEKGAANGVASLNAGSLVVQEPASASTAATGNTIAKRDGNGYLFAALLNSGNSASEGSNPPLVMGKNGVDGYLRCYTLSYAASSHTHGISQLSKAQGSGNAASFAVQQYAFASPLTGSGGVAVSYQIGYAGAAGNFREWIAQGSIQDTTWDYLTGSGHPRLWAEAAADDSIVAVWEAEDPADDEDPDRPPFVASDPSNQVVPVELDERALATVLARLVAARPPSFAGRGVWSGLTRPDELQRAVFERQLGERIAAHPDRLEMPADIRDVLSVQDRDTRTWYLQLYLRAASRVVQDHRASTLIPLLKDTFRVDRAKGLLLPR